MSGWQQMRRGVKAGLDLCCLAAVAPGAAMCAIEARLNEQNETAFTFWAQAYALVPGLPGIFLRRAFYRLTLDRCAHSFFIGFGAIFSHRRAIVEENVYIGAYAIVGSSILRRGCLLGSRASIISGTNLHVLDRHGRWSPSDLRRLRQIEIGEHAWIGEASSVMADVGSSAMVAAGAVVSTPVPPAVVVAGNPARFVRRLMHQGSEENHPVEASLSVR